MVNAPAPRQFASRIKVLIVDDHAVLRQALRMLLENQAEVEVVGDAGNGREALEAVEKLAPGRRPDGHGDARPQRPRGDAPDPPPRCPRRRC